MAAAHNSRPSDSPLKAAAVLGPHVRRVHMVGIGGAGMEGLARCLAAMGYRVTGSDTAGGQVTEDLRRQGMAVFQGHDKVHAQGADLVVYSAAIGTDNPERLAAEDAGIPTMRRAEVLGLLSRALATVAIAGTHGKTTTASLVAAVLQDAGQDPTVIVGGWVNGRTQSTAGSGALMVAEADEYDRSFLELQPRLAVVTNIESEHVDCYVDEADLVRTFATFLEQTHVDGHVVINGDDPLCRAALAQCANSAGRAVLSFGFDEACDVYATDLTVTAGGMAFTCVSHTGSRRLQVRLPGRHNVANALAAWAVAEVLGLDAAVATAALERFGGVDRRFHKRAVLDGIQIVDDYAHHPTEVQATLTAARQQMAAATEPNSRSHPGQNQRRLMAVLQPHTYSRTRSFHADFARALAHADHSWVAPVYAARERPEDGLESDVIVRDMSASGIPADLSTSAHAALREALAACRRGDWLVVMGAGDISACVGSLLSERGQ